MIPEIYRILTYNIGCTGIPSVAKLYDVKAEALQAFNEITPPPGYAALFQQIDSFGDFYSLESKASEVRF